MGQINDIAKEIHENAKAKGFYDGEINIGEMLALIHSEVSEALEADRKRVIVPEVKLEYINEWGDDQMFKQEFKAYIKDTFADELIDVIIRTMDLAIYKNIDIEQQIKAKMRYNTRLGYKHGKKY